MKNKSSKLKKDQKHCDKQNCECRQACRFSLFPFFFHFPSVAIDFDVNVLIYNMEFNESPCTSQTSMFLDQVMSLNIFNGQKRTSRENQTWHKRDRASVQTYDCITTTKKHSRQLIVLYITWIIYCVFKAVKVFRVADGMEHLSKVIRNNLDQR